MSKTVAELLNEQVNKELYSAYLYYDFAIYYEEKGLTGYANWFEIQAQEERDHALKFVKYMQESDMKVTLEAIAKPDIKINGFIDPLKEALVHEKYVTASINEIYAAADAAKDYRTMKFLDWFITEQGEEEASADANIRKFELFGGSPEGLYNLNSEMSTRVYTPPANEE